MVELTMGQSNYRLSSWPSFQIEEVPLIELEIVFHRVYYS